MRSPEWIPPGHATAITPLRKTQARGLRKPRCCATRRRGHPFENEEDLIDRSASDVSRK